MSKNKKENKVNEKDQIIKTNGVYISKLEQTVANQAITITKLETNIELMKG